jgi:tRNA/tmRNA/rRNA uracil-C5-methylase (TrmA/RlmC/RlmD family)
MNYRTGQLVQVTVGEVAHGGWCVARPGDGPAVFVRHALPGETVLARVSEVTSRLARAEAAEILAPSPDRVPPPCPHAGPGRCGGCDWQHAALPAQRSLKAAVIRQQLRRIAGLDREVTVEPLPGDEDAAPGGGEADGGGLGWRTRVQFAVGEDGTAGLRAHRSHEVIDVGRCLIAHPAITDLGIPGRRWPGTTSVEALAAPGSGEREVIVTGSPEPVRGMTADSVLRRSRRSLAPVRGRGYLTQRAAGREWRVSAGTFWQVHPGAADALADAVLAALGPRPGDVALDLYCGAGLFAGVLAPAVGPGGAVTGVEANRAAVRDARLNLREWPWARVRAGDVAQVLARGGAPPARLVVADPPRSGLAREVAEYLGAPGSGAARLAYVSCDPATLARDIRLLAGQGWSLDGLRAFDAFPMTHHVECVAALSRTPKAQSRALSRTDRGAPATSQLANPAGPAPSAALARDPAPAEAPHRPRAQCSALDLPGVRNLVWRRSPCRLFSSRSSRARGRGSPGLPPPGCAAPWRTSAGRARVPGTAR